MSSAIERRIVRLDERIPKPKPGCPVCRDYPDRRQCGELMAATCTFPDECPACGRAISYSFTRRYLGSIRLSDI